MEIKKKKKKDMLFLKARIPRPSSDRKQQHNFVFSLLINKMAFGRTSNVESSPGKPPLRGSFPLDHDGNLLIKQSTF